METDNPYEDINHYVCSLDRRALRHELTHFDGPFPLDFSADYLTAASTDKLRHILAAALWRTHQQSALHMMPRG